MSKAQAQKARETAAGTKRKLSARRTETDCRPYKTGKGRRESAYRAADHSLLADVPGRDLQDYGKEIQQKRCV